jgi:hypothetical protein
MANPKTVPEQLGMLVELTNRVLDRLKPKHAKLIGGPVNWGSLDCYCARAWMGDRGETGWTVYIQEAHSDASGLQQWVRDELAKAGWPGTIECVTDW